MSTFHKPTASFRQKVLYFYQKRKEATAMTLKELERDVPALAPRRHEYPAPGPPQSAEGGRLMFHLAL